MIARTFHRLFLFACGWSFGLACHSGLAQLPTIELHSLSRCGGQIGTSFDLAIQAGERIDEADQLFFSHPGIVGTPRLDPKSAFSEIEPIRFGHFHVSIAATVPPGLYEARVQGRFGLSNSRHFWVTKESWATASSGGLTWESATPMPLEKIVQDECGQRQRRFYRLDLGAKCHVNIRLLTFSLDSRARLIATLLDPKQRPVASSNVIENQDSSIDFQTSEAGIYTLVVSDHLFRGGSEYRYAMHAMESKISDSTNLIDRWRESLASLSADEPTGSNLLNQPWMPNRATLRMPIVEQAPVVHDESQFPDNQSCEIDFPSLIAGNFDSNADYDWFDFNLAAKKTVVIEVVSERLGENTDPQLILFRVQGSSTTSEAMDQVAIADDLSNVATVDVQLASRDAVLQYTPTEAGRYRLLVRDHQRSDGRAQGHRYAVELRNPVPNLSAVAYLAYPNRDPAQSRGLGPTIAKNGTLAVAVAVVRHDGWKGPVQFHTVGLPSDITASELVLDTTQTNGHLILRVAATAKASISSLLFLATATLHDERVTRVAKPIELTWGPIDTQKTPVSRVAAEFVLAVEDRDQIPLAIELGSTDVASVERGSKLKIPVALHRSEGGKQAVVVRLKNAPAKSKANDATIAADQNAGEVELNIPQDAPLGEFACWAQCETKLQLPLNPQALLRAQNRLAELELKKEKISAIQVKELEAAIVTQHELIKQMQESSKIQEFAVQIPSNAMRFRIVEKP